VASALGANIVLPTYRDLAARATTLEAAAATYASTLAPADLDAARVAWRELALVVSFAEPMQLGPAGLGGTTIESVAGGQGLRVDLYAWEVASPCRIDEETVAETYADLDTLGLALVNVRTLAAVEYLLFVDSTANACSATAAINASGSWTTLVSSGLVERRRADYAAAAAVLVRRAAEALVTAWEPTEGDFLGELERAGAGGMVYPSAQEALNAISDAMFYVDDTLKDMKLGAPAGITICLEAICADLRESRFADDSRALMLENLRAFRSLYLGGDPGGGELGFDDLLLPLGATDLAARMSSAIAAAITAVEAIPEPFVDALTTDHAAIAAAHAAVRPPTAAFRVSEL
jgi:predicted lipoprotein